MRLELTGNNEAKIGFQLPRHDFVFLFLVCLEYRNIINIRFTWLGSESPTLGNYEVQAAYNAMFSGHFEAFRDKLGRAWQLMLADTDTSHFNYKLDHSV